MRNRGLRRQQRQRIINARVALRLAMEGGRYIDEVEVPGRYSSRHPYDCGNAGCLLCHWEKRYKKPRNKNWFNLIDHEGD